MPILRQREQACQIAQQRLTRKHRRKLAVLGFLHPITRGVTLANHAIQHQGRQRRRRDPALLQHAGRAHASLTQRAQKMLRGNVNLAAGQGNAAGFVQRDEHLIRQVGRHILIGEISEVSRTAITVARLRFAIFLQFGQLKAAILGQFDDGAIGCAFGHTQERQERDLRQQQGPAHLAHQVTGPVEGRARGQVQQIAIELSGWHAAIIAG